MDRAALDTTFLIAVALGEYLEGFSDPTSPEARALVDPLNILEVTEDAAQVYAATARHLRSVGQLNGTNDLWIGCTARAAHLALVTRNAEHFSRIPGLHVITYFVQPSSTA